MSDHATDPVVQRLLRERVAKLFLAAGPPELREAYEGDLSERLQQDVIAERGVDGARRWLRRELLRSTPRMLAQRARGGAHPLRRATLAIVLLVLAILENEAGAHASSLFSLVSGQPVHVTLVRAQPFSIALGWVCIALFAFAIVVRARATLHGLWFACYALGAAVAFAEGSSDPFPITRMTVLAITVAVTFRLPWRFWSWRFLTTFDGRLEKEPRRPRAS